MTERRVIRALNVATVARAAFALSLCVWGIAFVGLVALYLLGLVSGGLGGVEGFIASLGFTGFRLTILPFLAVFIVAAVVVSAIAGVAAGLLAFLYNGLVPIVGGIEVTTEGWGPSRAPAPVDAPKAPLQSRERRAVPPPAVTPRPSVQQPSERPPRPFPTPQRWGPDAPGTTPTREP